jgi:sporulation protein YlmC with PRC-barrel domain
MKANVSKQQLENKKGFAKSQWPGMDDEYWTRSASSGAAGGTQQGAGNLTLVRASELEGKQVQASGGEEIDELKDVIVGLNGGQVRNVVIDLKDSGQAMLPAKQQQIRSQAGTQQKSQKK